MTTAPTQPLPTPPLPTPPLPTPLGRARAVALTAAVAALALAAFGWWTQPQAFFQSWLLAFLLWSGLAIGCLSVLMVGHLTSEPWLAPVRAELEAGALTLPLLALLGLPLLAGMGELYRWPDAGGPMAPVRSVWLDRESIALRSAVYLAVWSGLAWVVTRPRGNRRRVSAVGLLLMLPTVTLAGVDWVMALDPDWLSSLYGLAYGVTQMAAALAAVLVVALLRPGGGGRAGQEGGMAGALLALVGTTAYLWFVHFLVVWAANLPEEAGWYLRRAGAWLLLMPGVVVPCAVLATLLLLPRRLRGRRVVLLSAGGLLLVQHVAHMLWLVRPAAERPELHWLDPVCALAIGAAAAAVAAPILARRSAPDTGGNA